MKNEQSKVVGQNVRITAPLKKTITVILEEGANNWGAHTPDDIGSVIVTAPTREEVIKQFRSALNFHLRGMREDGLPTPDVTELEIRELIAA